MAHNLNVGLTDMPTVYNVSFPVGPGMPNTKEDVLLVQTLMKLANFDRIHPGHGPVETSRNIKIDGFFGPQTKRLTEAFEALSKTNHLLLIADGIFESSSKDGFTGKGILYKIIHLNRRAKKIEAFQYGNLPKDPNTHPILRGALERNKKS